MKEKFNLRENYEIGKTSWFGVGGKVDFFFKPKSWLQLKEFLREKGDLPVTIIGNSSNLIIRDGGIEGAVVRLGSAFSEVSRKGEDLVEVGAGLLDKNFAIQMAEAELSGFEFLSTIPGNLGGGVKMNCGCFGGEISDVLVSVKGLDLKGNEVFFERKDINFSYRESGIPDDVIITSMVLKGVPSSKLRILRWMEENQDQRNKSQPIGGKTCGSTFKNPKDSKAWELLRDSGVGELKIGGAYFSAKHINFLMNDGTATAKQIEEIGELARKLVFEKTGILLEWEVKRIGRKL